MRTRRCNPSRADGVALISVLLVAALLAVVTHQLTARHSLGLAQSQSSLGYDQALAYALGGEALARQILHEDWVKDQEENDSGKPADHLQEPWAQAVPPLALDAVGLIEIQARDLNGCFNVNALAGQEDEPAPGEPGDGAAEDPSGAPPDAPSPGGASHLGRFKTLLRNLQVAERAAEAALDWMDDNQEVSQTGLDAGAEDQEYLGQEPAYRTSDRRLAHISELRLLHGMTQADFERLAPHVCALPTDRLKINVNTATSQTLAALEPTAMVDELRMQRLMETERAFEDLSDFTAQDAFPEFGGVSGLLSVASEYFEVQVRVQVGRSIAVLTSVLHRDLDNGAMTLLSRDMGRDFLSRLEVQTEES